MRAYTASGLKAQLEEVAAGHSDAGIASLGTATRMNRYGKRAERGAGRRHVVQRFGPVAAQPESTVEFVEREPINELRLAAAIAAVIRKGLSESQGGDSRGRVDRVDPSGAVVSSTP